MAQGEEIGKVVHYFDKIMVAVIVLTKDLKVGDTVKLVGKDREFSQTVTSMQVEHQPVQEAKKGTEAAVKIDQPVRKNWKVYKVS